jgi:protein-tyrosine phosphatase
MNKILMVCLGNICRSPLAQGILEQKAKNSDIKIIVDSAGTGNWHVGSPPDIRSIETAKYHDIDISNQKARQFNSNDFNNFDKILVMDTSNLTSILRLCSKREDEEKVKLILDYTFPNSQESVPDPYYGGKDGFENVFKLIDKACNKIVDELN